MASAPGTVLTGGGSFRIERTSDIDVLVNGVSVRRLHLRPGTYNFRDLPLGAGASVQVDPEGWLLKK